MKQERFWHLLQAWDEKDSDPLCKIPPTSASPDFFVARYSNWAPDDLLPEPSSDG